MFLSERAIVHFYHGYEEKYYGEGKGGFPKERYRFIILKRKKTPQYKRMPLRQYFQVCLSTGAGCQRDEPNQHTVEKER